MNKIRLLGIFLLVLMIVIAVGVVYAHVVYQQGWVYWSQDDCVFGRSEISHGNYGKGYVRVDTQAYRGTSTPSGYYPCSTYMNRPPGFMAQKVVLYKWTGSQWAVCWETPWLYNPIETWWIMFDTHFMNVPCGSGYYANYGAHFEYNGGWHGGWIWSGAHYLPAQ
ncbi:hypothetical protein [Thermoflexus hugenholtzii]